MLRKHWENFFIIKFTVYFFTMTSYNLRYDSFSLEPRILSGNEYNNENVTIF